MVQGHSRSRSYTLNEQMDTEFSTYSPQRQSNLKDQLTNALMSLDTQPEDFQVELLTLKDDYVNDKKAILGSLLAYRLHYLKPRAQMALLQLSPDLVVGRPLSLHRIIAGIKDVDGKEPSQLHRLDLDAFVYILKLPDDAIDKKMEALQTQLREGQMRTSHPGRHYYVEWTEFKAIRIEEEKEMKDLIKEERKREERREI